MRRYRVRWLQKDRHEWTATGVMLSLVVALLALLRVLHVARLGMPTALIVGAVLGVALDASRKLLASQLRKRAQPRDA